MIKPMLAATVENINTLPYPMIATPKLDGIRCLKINGQVVTRKLKPIQNHYIRILLEELLPEGADGEIIVGGNFQDCTSGVMCREGMPDFKFWMFDIIGPHTYFDRLKEIRKWSASRPPRNELRFVPFVWVNNPVELERFERNCLDSGYEGVCLRTPDSPYKYGRSTVKQAWLLKLKRFVDAEAVIYDLEEQFKNTNPLETDELGYAKRSKTKNGREGKNTLGRFLVRDLTNGVEFAVGTGLGLTDQLRKEIWENKNQYFGKVIKYKSQPFGIKDKPRLPVFLGFRED